MDNYCGKPMNKEQHENLGIAFDHLEVEKQGGKKLRDAIVNKMGNRNYMGVSYKWGSFSDNDIDSIFNEVFNEVSKDCKISGIKQFAEKLKESAQMNLDHFMGFQKVVLVEQIDELLKEYEK